MARRARRGQVHSDVTQEVNFIEGKKTLCPCGVAKVKERSTAVFRFRAVLIQRDGCQRYVAGSIDIRQLHRLSVAPLARHALSELRQWAAEFEREIAPQLPEAMRALVRQHQDAGHLCAIVTATTELVAEPFGRLFGIEHVLCTQAQEVDGALTGEIVGAPCHGAGKLQRVNHWLSERGTSLAAFQQSWFYSDSISDLPLLRAVTDPVAVAPDPALRAEAGRCGWPVMERV
jgi:HAD superfamily hydrolase (TIGR01490 family)